MMKFIFSLAFILFTSILFCQDYSQYVNPFIGTGGHGHTFPGATFPNGFMQLSPDTRLTGWDGCSGYHDSDTVIYGFSHTHLSGTGVSDYGDILLMPTTGGALLNNGAHKGINNGYASSFTKGKETAQPGFYQVYLDDYEINVKLATTSHAGIHEYTFNTDKTTDKNIILDLLHRDELVESDIQQTDENEISGKRISTAWAREQHVYFVIQFSELISDVTFFDTTAFGSNTQAIIKLPNNLNSIKVKVGISAVSIENARENLEHQIPHWDFNKVQFDARNQWNKELSKFDIQANDSIKEIFYTALYHSLVAPNLFTDTNKQYRGTDLKIYESDRNIYTIFSLWDTYRSTHPLYTLIDEEKTLDFIHTFLTQYKNGGQLPVWELAGNYTGCMIGYHSIPVIVDAYMKGIDDFDADLAMEAMIHSANMNHLGLPEYKEFGFIPSEMEAESVSKTLEYAYDDWCIARMASKMGRYDIAEDYMKRAQFYKNLFDPSIGFFRNKKEHIFHPDFDAREVNFNFTEANAWQYTFYVPQDIETMVDLYGGKDAFGNKLDELFSTPSETVGRHQVDITGLVGQYAHGNEPSHHIAYLYNFASQPWKTQEKVRYIMDKMYSTNPDGLIGNEDCGQMSSWYVFSALGFYPVCPGSNQYVLGSPVIDKATIRLPNGNVLIIEVNNQSKENMYVDKVFLNGNEIDKNYISHSQLKGGKLTFQMSNQPNKTRGISESSNYSSRIEKSIILPSSSIITKKQVFTDSTEIQIVNIEKTNKIFYTLDGTSPNSNSKRYSSPFYLNHSAVLKTITYDQFNRSSIITETPFYKLDTLTKVEIKSKYNSQYTAGGDIGLIDGLRGGKDFRTGAWQGYQYQDFEALVSFNEIKDVSYIASGYIQDIRSWIWMPTEVTYEYSLDGVNFTSIGSVLNDVDDKSYDVKIKDFEIKTNIQAKYIRVKAKNYGTIPEWHLGAGDGAFIFVDEIIIR